MRYRIFTRNWWKLNPEWEGGREPSGSERKTTIGHASSEAEARAICKKYNDKHPSGKLGKMAEYE